MALVNIYKDNPTAGATDGTVVSTGGTFTSQIVFELDATQNESKVQKCAIRTEAGYKTSGDTTISDSGDTNDRVKLCKTENGTFTDSITFTEEITNANKIFYVKATSSSDEYPQRDRSIGIRYDCYLVQA